VLLNLQSPKETHLPTYSPRKKIFDDVESDEIASLCSLSPDIILRSWQLSGLHPFEPTIPLKHPCILLTDEDKSLKIDPSGKDHGDRYSISGKVIT